MQIYSETKEVFSTPHGKVSQFDHKQVIQLEYKNVCFELSVREFLDLKRKVKAIDLDKMAMCIEDDYDRITISTRKIKTMQLTLCQAYHLKELMEGASAMLTLNSIIQERIYCMHKSNSL